MCECESWKIKYLQKAFPDTPMLFDDMRRLGSGRAFDANTKTVKDVPKALGSKIVFKCSFDMGNRASNLEKWNVIISCFKKFFQDVLDLAAPDRKQFLECFLPSLGCILTPSHGQADAVVIGYSCKSLSKQNKTMWIMPNQAWWWLKTFLVA